MALLAWKEWLVFSVGLGGTLMVVYGSYMAERENLARNALVTAAGDVIAGLLAGLAILPAVFALGLATATGGFTQIGKLLPGLLDSNAKRNVFMLAFAGIVLAGRRETPVLAQTVRRVTPAAAPAADVVGVAVTPSPIA